MELFTTYNTPPEKKSLSAALLQKIVSYERFLCLGIFFLVVFVLAYSLGMEKGKRLKVVRRSPGRNAISRPSYVPSSHNAKDIEKKPGKAGKAKDKVKKNSKDDNIKSRQRRPQGEYTVQVASFRKKHLAEKEKSSLENKGYQVYVIPKNKYIIVCVGAFKDRDKAKINQKKLRRLYNDCLVRKL
ncbi:MAG: SPOR domain-containing protein [Candidatus Omnitrophota bacterium]